MRDSFRSLAKEGAELSAFYSSSARRGTSSKMRELRCSLECLVALYLKRSSIQEGAVNAGDQG
jgi:hypothetical protein